MAEKTKSDKPSVAVSFDTTKVLTGPEVKLGPATNPVVTGQIFLTGEIPGVTISENASSEKTTGVQRAQITLPKFDVTDRIYGTDAWFIDTEKQLRPVAWLLEQGETDLGALCAYATPVFTPQDLSSSEAMHTALNAWYTRAEHHFRQTNPIEVDDNNLELARDRALEILRRDTQEYRAQVSGYIKEYRKNASAWAEKSKPAPEDAHRLVVSALQDEKFIPLSFAIMLNHSGTRFILTDDDNSRATKQYFTVIGRLNEKMQEDKAELYNHLSRLLIRTIASQLEKTALTSEIVQKQLAAEMPAKELICFTNTTNNCDVLGLIHANHPAGTFSASLFQWNFPDCMLLYTQFMGLTNDLAIRIRPDLNNEIEYSRVAFTHKNDALSKEQREYSPLSVEKGYRELAHQPVISQTSPTYGTPPEEAVHALALAYENMSPSTRHFYGMQTIGFMLTGPDKPEFANTLGIGDRALIVGHDYLDPAKIRRWFTGIPLKPDEPVTLEDLNEDAIRAAASRGLIRSGLVQFQARMSDFGKAYEKELERRIPQSYIDTEAKTALVASIIGEICNVSRSDKLHKIFPGCVQFSSLALRYLYTRGRELLTSEHSINLPPGSSSFSINRSPETLTQPQMRLFEVINNLMQEMQVTPGDMDAAFQFEAYRIFNWQYMRTIQAAAPARNSLKKMDFSEDSPLMKRVEGYEAAPQHKLDWQDTEKFFGINNHVMPKNFILPTYATPAQREAYDKAAALRTSDRAKEEIVPYGNFLQAYASGFNSLEAINKHNQTGTFVPLSKVFEVALLTAVDQFVEQKYSKASPEGIRELRAELQNLFTVIDSHDVDRRIDELHFAPRDILPAIDKNAVECGLVFQDHDTLHLLEQLVQEKLLQAGSAQSPVIDQSANIISAVEALQIIHETVIPELDFTHQIHGTDECYIDTDMQLRSLAELLEIENPASRILMPYTPVFKPHELSSAEALSTAVDAWHVRMLQQIDLGFHNGSRDDAQAILEKDFHILQDRLPDFVETYKNNAISWAEKSRPLPADICDTLITMLRDEKLTPPAFALTLAYHGFRFIVSDGGLTLTQNGERIKDWGLAINPNSGFMGIGPYYIEKLHTPDRLAKYGFSHLIVSAISTELANAPETQEALKVLHAESSGMRKEIENDLMGTGGTTENVPRNLYDTLALMHFQHALEPTYVSLARYQLPTSLIGYEKFIEVATDAAICLRPDLNNALERSRATYLTAGQPLELSQWNRDKGMLALEPLIFKNPRQLGTPSEQSVSLLVSAYKDLYPSTRHVNATVPTLFMLTGPEKPDYASTLEFVSGKTALIAGSDYFNPVLIRRLFTGKPVQPGQAITIDNLDEHAVRAAMARGMINGAIYGLYVHHDQKQSPAIDVKFERELESRVAPQYRDTPVKRAIMAAMVGEISSLSTNKDTHKKFEHCTRFKWALPHMFYEWDNNMILECASVQPTGSSTFTINRSPAILTQPQIRLFEVINDLMCVGNITPQELDAAFRFEALKMINWMGIQEADWIEQHKNKRPELSNYTTAAVQHRGRAFVRQIEGYDGFPASIGGYDEDTRAEAKIESQSYTENVEKRYAPYDISAPAYATAAECDGYSFINEQGKGTKSYTPPYNNVLQTYASGQNSLAVTSAKDTELSPNNNGLLFKFKRPSFDTVFRLAILGAIDELVKFKFANTEVPASVTALRLELDSLFSPVDIDVVFRGVKQLHLDFEDVSSASGQGRGLVFQHRDILYLLEKETLNPTPRPSTIIQLHNGQENGKGSPLPDGVSAKSSGTETRSEVSSTSTIFSGAVIQRIFREAGKSHPNNSPEREDDIARMKWLEKQLRSIGELII